MMGNWRVVETGAGDATWNMAIDWALLELRGEGAIPDTLRFYTWREKAVSLGYSQDIGRELDVLRCRRYGVKNVFRPTGGALVLHQFDLTYSLVVGMPRLNPSGWTDFGRRVGCALCRALWQLGVRSACEESEGVRGRRNRGACFASLAQHEITVDGRKIVGNAKRWRAGALLQHGSVSLRRASLSVVDLMAGLSTEKRISMKADLRARSTTLEDEVGHHLAYDDLWPIVFSGFRAEFGSIFETGELGAIEASRADRMLDRVISGPTRRCVPRGGTRVRTGAGAHVNPPAAC
jgi:lipoate-protein ligase A